MLSHYFNENFFSFARLECSCPQQLIAVQGKKKIIIIMYISHFYVLSSVKIIYLFKINAYLVGHMDNFSLQCNQKRIGTG
jgi:hypothetical protein